MLLLLALALVLCHSAPLACLPNDVYPMVPFFHIIGNITKTGWPTKDGIHLEPINDASGVTFYKGIYHVWHQCCQNHWDHLISKDLIHWQRLSPPIQPVTLKTWDGSITMLPESEGGPIILYDAQDGKQGSHGTDPRGKVGDSPIVGVARLVDPSDPYLLLWKRAEDNPITFVGPPIAFPGPIWSNAGHYNFVGQGNRFQSNDTAFHTWTNMGPFVGLGEVSGQWWFPLPAQVGGSPPPPGSPTHAVNVGDGSRYLLGTYDPSTETFTPWSPEGEKPGRIARLEGGSASWWGASGGSDNGGRAMMIGWAEPDFVGPDAGPGFSFLTRLTLLREINWDVASGTLVSNPVPELLGLRGGALAQERAVPMGGTTVTPHAVPGVAGGAAASSDMVITWRGLTNSSGAFGACVLSNGTVNSGIGIFIGEADQYFMPGVDIPGGDYNVTNVNYTDPHICQAACTGDGEKCKAYTYVVRPPLHAACCLKGTVDTQDASAACTSGIKGPPTPGQLRVRVGACAGPLGGGGGDSGIGTDTGSGSGSSPTGGTVSVRADGSVSVRILPDRSVADFFVNGGVWAATQAWPGTVGRSPSDSSVLVWGGEGVTADIDVWSMGCGWADPSYTEHPTM